MPPSSPGLRSIFKDWNEDGKPQDWRPGKSRDKIGHVASFYFFFVVVQGTGGQRAIAPVPQMPQMPQIDLLDLAKVAGSGAVILDLRGAKKSSFNFSMQMPGGGEVRQAAGVRQSAAPRLSSPITGQAAPPAPPTPLPTPPLKESPLVYWLCACHPPPKLQPGWPVFGALILPLFWPCKSEKVKRSPNQMWDFTAVIFGAGAHRPQGVQRGAEFLGCCRKWPKCRWWRDAPLVGSPHSMVQTLAGVILPPGPGSNPRPSRQ